MSDDAHIAHIQVRRLSAHAWALTPENVKTIECFCYALETRAGVVLIDCGSGATWPDILAGLACAGLPRPLAVFVTHAHIDHAGGTARAVADGLPVYAHPGVFEALLKRRERVWYEHPDRVETPRADLLFRVEPGRSFGIGELSLEVMATPGHTSDHVAYVFEEPGLGTVACSGDLICSDGQPGWAGSEDFDEGALRTSIAELAERRPVMLLGGHWVMSDGTAKLRHALALAESGGWKLDTRYHD